MKFLIDHQDVIHRYMNLDVVNDAAASKRNANIMKESGLNPIEIWHIGSSLRELDSLIKEDHSLIAIGGSVGVSEKKRKRVFRRIFKLYSEQNFHFLGGSSMLLNCFPWFSADSTGWSVGRMYGSIIDEKGQRKAPEGMEGLDALAYNCRYFTSLEFKAS